VKVKRRAGIGSMMNSFKPSLLIAKYLNLTVIPTDNYFHWHEYSGQTHQTYFLRTTGFGFGLDCTEEEVIDTNIVNHNMTKLVIDLKDIKTSLTNKDNDFLFYGNCAYDGISPPPNGLLHYLYIMCFMMSILRTRKIYSYSLTLI